MHYCAYHKLEEPESKFRGKKNGKLDSWCIEGRKEHGRAYSKNAYATRKAQVAEEKAARETRETQVCTGSCGLELPIKEFPERSDRPGKRHAMCIKCRQQVVHQYNLNSYTKHDGRAYASKKRAIIAQATIGDRIENATYIEILEHDPCSYCGTNPIEKYETDHIVPLNPMGKTHGDHDWTNFTAACKVCNNSKLNTPLLHFLLRKRAPKGAL